MSVKSSTKKHILSSFGLSKQHKKSEWERFQELTHRERRTYYEKKAEEAWNLTWDIYTTDDGWRLECGKDVLSGWVKARHFNGIGKVYKAEGIIEHASRDELFRELIFNLEDIPSWNPTMKECRVVEKIDESTDICYKVSAEALGGLVSSRDYVNLRHWKTRDDTILSTGWGVCHLSCPPNRKHVRAENLPGAWLFKHVDGEPNKSLFMLILHSETKGWLPTYVVDQATSGVLLEYVHYLQQHMERKKNHSSS